MDTSVINIGLTIANVLILAGNLIILGFSLKLYTEYMKDKSMDGRMKNKS